MVQSGLPHGLFLPPNIYFFFPLPLSNIHEVDGFGLALYKVASLTALGSLWEPAQDSDWRCIGIVIGASKRSPKS